jgi:hypothetical protein
MKDISLAACPELILLAQDNETEIDIGKLSTEQILIRWINYHVKHFQGEENSTYEMRSFLDVHKVIMCHVQLKIMYHMITPSLLCVL